MKIICNTKEKNVFNSFAYLLGLFFFVILRKTILKLKFSGSLLNLRKAPSHLRHYNGIHLLSLLKLANVFPIETMYNISITATEV